MSHEDSWDLFEACPMICAEFHVKKENGTEVIHEAEVNMAKEITYVKEDLADLFGSKNQMWHYKNQPLDDNKALYEYEWDFASKQGTAYGARRFCRVEFHYQLSEGGTVSLHQADCLTSQPIRALKEDLVCVFGPTRNQIWNYQTVYLDENKDLEWYGIDGRSTRHAKIMVLNRSRGSSDVQS